MATIKSSRLSGVANGTVLTTSTAGSGDAVFTSVTGTNTITGSRIVTPATASAVVYQWSGFSLTTWSVRVYVTVNTGATVAAVPFVVADSLWRLSLTGSGQFALRDGGNVARSYSAPFVLGNEYCISAYGNDTSTAITWGILNVSDGSTFLPATTVSGIVSSGGTQFSTLTFGRNSSTLAGPLSLAKHWVGDVQVLRGLDGVGIPVTARSDNITVINMTNSVAGMDGALSYAISPTANTYEPVDGVFYISHAATSQTFTITMTEASTSQTTTSTVTVPAAQGTRRRAYDGTTWL